MTFEKTYPRYPFSELVRLGLLAAKGILRLKRWQTTTVADRRASLAGQAGAAVARPRRECGRPYPYVGKPAKVAPDSFRIPRTAR